MEYKPCTLELAKNDSDLFENPEVDPSFKEIKQTQKRKRVEAALAARKSNFNCLRPRSSKSFLVIVATYHRFFE